MYEQSTLSESIGNVGNPFSLCYKEQVKFSSKDLTQVQPDVQK